MFLREYFLLFEGGEDFVKRRRLFEFDVYRFRMAVIDGDAHGGCGYGKIRRMQNFAGFVYHFVFFLGVAVVQHNSGRRGPEAAF